MTLKQKKKLIKIYKETILQTKSSYEYDLQYEDKKYSHHSYFLSGKIEGMVLLLDILGLIDPKTGNIIEGMPSN